MTNSKNLLDIENRQETFQGISKRMKLLNEGFRALYADFSHHIEVVHGKDHDILSLRENIDYRLFCSQFHLELLLRQHFLIESRIEKIYGEDPSKILNPVYPSHPLFDYCEREISSIFDSIIFHLASVYDYLSAIINFICNKKDRSITKWSQLDRSCRDQGNFYNSLEISKIILNESDEFVDRLYKYRSRIIHEKSEINPISLSIKVSSGKTIVKFLAKQTLTKKFSELKVKSANNDFTVAYISEWLIHKTLTSIANILFGLKTHMETVSNFPNHIGNNDLFLLYRDPETGIAEPVSKPMWNNVKEKIFLIK